MEQKKKLQLKKETVAILNGQGMSRVVGGGGQCINDLDCTPDQLCVEGKCGGGVTNFTKNDVASACVACKPPVLTTGSTACRDPYCV